MDKLTVVTPLNENWEYRCHSCGQLRLSLGEKHPTSCGSCGKQELEIGRPGTLSTKED